MVPYTVEYFGGAWYEVGIRYNGHWRAVAMFTDKCRAEQWALVLNGNKKIVDKSEVIN